MVESALYSETKHTGKLDLDIGITYLMEVFINHFNDLAVSITTTSAISSHESPKCATAMSLTT